MNRRDRWITLPRARNSKGNTRRFFLLTRLISIGQKARWLSARRNFLNTKATFVERAALAKLLIGVYRLNFAESHEAKSIIMSLKDESNGDEARFWSLTISVMAPAKQP